MKYNVPYRKIVFITNVPYCISQACSHISYIGAHVMVYSVTLARTDILPEDGHTVTETCRRFYEVLAF